MRALLSIFVVLVLSGAVGAADSKDGESSREERCPVCGMYVSPFADWNAEVVFDDSSRAVMDGPKDLFKYYNDIGKYNPSKSTARVTALYVRDYGTKKKIDARKAYFVIWSDTYGPMGHEPIPFEKESDAKKFLEEHKGRQVLRFNEVTPQVIHALDNPA